MSLTTAESPYSVRATVDRVIAVLERRGIEVLAHVDHGAGARAAGLELADEELLSFGDPRVGTPLMQSDPAIGYELPLRLLVWDAAGQTTIGYRPPTELADQYDVAEQAGVLERMKLLLEQIVADSVASDERKDGDAGKGGRERRLAANEEAFRAVNEAIERGQWPGEEDDHVAFRCECARLECNRLIDLTPREYERVRAHPRQFLLLPGHEVTEVETIVQTEPGYLVVEKLGQAGASAEESDPRD